MACYYYYSSDYTDFYALVDSWVEVSSQPSSSSLSSVADEIVTTGLRVQDDPRTRRRRANRPGAPTHLHITRTQSVGGTSSQEEYEESESESDRIMTSSGEGPIMATPLSRATSTALSRGQTSSASAESAGPVSDDDENRTAVNQPIGNDTCFTPLPNAFSHPPSSQLRNASQPVPGSYFPATRPTMNRLSTRHSMSSTTEQRRHSHISQNPLSPSFNAAAEHDEMLRASLTGLLSVAAAARSLSKTDPKGPSQTAPPPRSNRVDPMTFRLVPESALQHSSPTQEPTFKPTIRRTSTNSTSTTSERQNEHKRKALAAPARSSSRERRAMKKARRSTSTEDLHVTPTLLTWVVSAGVVMFLSALSFGAGYSIGKEAGRLEAGSFAADEQLRTCAQEAGRSSLGLKRSLARSAIQV